MKLCRRYVYVQSDKLCEALLETLWKQFSYVQGVSFICHHVSEYFVIINAARAQVKKEKLFILARDTRIKTLAFAVNKRKSLIGG